MLENTKYIFNVRAKSPDGRDFSFKQNLSPIREFVDLRQFDSPIEDQGSLGSCVSHAVTSAYENQVKQKYPEDYVELSRLYHYYHARYLENYANGDIGVFELRNALKALKKHNICSEKFWPYEILKYNTQPFPDAYADAKNRTIDDYFYIRDTPGLINALNENYPVVVGMDIFSNFMEINSSSPIVTTPGENEQTLGGHSVCLVGYSIPEKVFLAKNSFGKDWGSNGYCWISFDYADKHIFDKWIFNVKNPKFCRDANIVAIKTVSVPLTEIPNNNNNKKEIKMAENSYGYDTNLHLEHGAIRHDIAVESARLSAQLGSEACGIRAGQGDIRRETAVGFGDTRYNIATNSGDIKHQIGAEHCKTNDIIRQEGQEGVLATKDAEFDISNRITNSADRVSDRMMELRGLVGQRFHEVSHDLATVKQGQATLAKDVELNSIKGMLENQKNTQFLSDKIAVDGDKTRSLINDLKYHDLNRSLVERNAELVCCEQDRRHWRHSAEQNQFAGQWAALQSQIQAFASQLQDTRQGLVNFGSMNGNAGQQSSTSNNVR
jgi:hypothetical protein